LRPGERGHPLVGRRDNARMQTPARQSSSMRLAAFIAAVSVTLSIGPSGTPLVAIAHQIVAVLGWGLVLLMAPAPAPTRDTLRAAAPLLAALGLAAMGCLAAIVFGSLPSPPGAAILFVILVSGAVALHGASAGAAASDDWFVPFAIALVVAGVVGAAIACIQIFAVGLADNFWIAIPADRGRAYGNIGQPNQFGDVLVWALIGLAGLAQRRDRALPSRLGLAGLMLFLLLGVALTGSRTALVSLALLAAWGLLDRRLERATRVALAIAPGIAIALGVLVRAATVATLTARKDADVTSFRLDIWSDTLSIIRAQPWTGVGWGQFNFAWTLTPFAWRPAGLVDNAHDLPLQLAAELGIPAAMAIFGLLLWSVWRALQRVRALEGAPATAGRCALMIVLVIGLHSLLEYPLWYAYLLFPAAWAWGLLLGTGCARSVAPPSAATPPPSRAWRAMGLLMGIAALSAWADYRIVAPLFAPSDTPSPLDERIHDAQASPLFSYLADYAVATSVQPTPRTLPALKRSAHVLLNEPLLYGWANLLQAQGETDKARYMAARLREFRLPGVASWYAPCDDPAVTTKPFQCLAPEHPVTWRDFR
jgi:O-antigen ligase